MSRLPSFRPRTITVDAQLVIVRSQDELTEEGTVTRVVHHGHQQLDRENEEARPRPPPAVAAAARRKPQCALLRLGAARRARPARENPRPARPRLPACFHIQPGTHATLAQVLTVKAREPKQGKSDEIPTPEVWAVPTYETDYRPTFRPPTSYLRGALLRRPLRRTRARADAQPATCSELQTRRRAVRVRPGQRRRGLARCVQRRAEPPARRTVRRPPAAP